MITTPTNRANLHSRFRHYGTLTLTYRNKCIGMLPRIFKEKIYVEKGFDSIFEYAAKFAGLSREQVNRALSLHASFCDKPTLRATMETGEVSINKLAKIASIATVDNQEFLSDQAKLLSCRALETLARDLKYATPPNHHGDANMVTLASTTTKISNQNGLFKPKTDENFVHVNKSATPILRPESSIALSHGQDGPNLSLELSPEVQQKLLELQSKGLDVNAILLELLEKREQEIEQERITASASTTQKPSRYIPTRIRKLLAKEHGTKCSIRNCGRPSQEIHHTRRFALDGSHDPHYLAPLCREHHQIAHSIDIRFHEMRRKNGT